MTDALVFAALDTVPGLVDLESSTTPSSSSSTLPSREAADINWIDFTDFSGFSPATPVNFDPMLVPGQLSFAADPSEQALLTTLGAFFAPLDSLSSHTLPLGVPSDTRAAKQPYNEMSILMPNAASTAATTPDLSLLLPTPSPSSGFLTDDEKWQAVLTRDSAADSQFVYCVTSTRIYCRPTCASRRPLRANTVYADTPAEAEVLGYRACRRCLPHCLASASEMRQVLAVEQAKVVIAECVRDGRPAPSLSVLAQHVGMSKFHLQRTFKRLVGHSPDAHAKALAKAWRGVGRG